MFANLPYLLGGDLYDQFYMTATMACKATAQGVSSLGSTTKPGKDWSRGLMPQYTTMSRSDTVVDRVTGDGQGENIYLP